MAHVVKPMSHLRHIEWRVVFLAFLQTGLQILARLPYPTRDFDEGNDLLLQFAIAEQTVHGFHKHIDTFIAELITA